MSTSESGWETPAGGARKLDKSEENSINSQSIPKDQIPILQQFGNKCNFPRKGDPIWKTEGLEIMALEIKIELVIKEVELKKAAAAVRTWRYGQVAIGWQDGKEWLTFILGLIGKIFV